MVQINDAHGEIAGAVAEIDSIQHIESIHGILEACFHRCHSLARQALQDGTDSREAQALAAKLDAIFNETEA